MHRSLPLILATFALSICLKAQVVQLPLSVVPAAHGKWSLPRHFDRQLLGQHASEAFGVPSKAAGNPPLSPAATGSFGWETIQLGVGLGTPPQYFNLSLDYTQATVVAFAKGYTETHCTGASASRHTFDKTLSGTLAKTQNKTTYQLTVAPPYGDVKDCGSKPATGQSTGYLVMDNIVIGSSNAAVSFFLMNHSQHLNPQWGSDGWFGMAIDPFNCRYDERNCTVLGFLKAFSQPVVAVYLKGNRANYFSSGIISFGSTSLSQCRWSAWTWLPKGEPRFPGWNVMLKSFSLPSYNSGALNQPAALMTNAAYIWAPPANFKKIISALDAEYSFADDEYVVKCADVANNQGAMTFTFDGYNQVATPYRALPRDPKTCVVLVRDSSEFFPAGLNVWVLGNSFMLDACHAFDYKNQLIGFAQAS